MALDWQSSIEQLAAMARENRVEEANTQIDEILNLYPEVVGQWFLISKLLAGQDHLWENRIATELERFGSAPARAYRATLQTLNRSVQAQQPQPEAPPPACATPEPAIIEPVVEPSTAAQPTPPATTSIDERPLPIPNEPLAVAPQAAQPLEPLSIAAPTPTPPDQPLDEEQQMQLWRLQGMLGRIYVYDFMSKTRNQQKQRLTGLLQQVESYRTQNRP
ncbi:hypothetical protein Mmc1_0669 [Magnetococcus marinus MC-1]|uniref:Uncharacterized protein n=1 Tax=Magnetococcus marinus (strain ATCC BAA-1437 / JCM 17883 / MC-1) TaxID=156889 RepID=A0L5E7_MAGMM|nr:hypothetical protein [Magnetococcus marinus]ABK43190.1 hypothetical protein Mmc1_0669 [Magnetococcus marinus MC-1]